MNSHSIVIIAVYFGKLPAYFQLWLNSCRYNSQFEWLVFTDADTTIYDTPSNVKYRFTTLKELLYHVGKCAGIPVDARSPYKICDFRPLYWTLLDSEDKFYHFWGHCDLDMIFGDLKRWITPDLLNNYDKIFSVGHLTLYRNCEISNQMFRRWHPQVSWKVVLSDPSHRGFDEHIGVNRIWRLHRGRMFEDESFIADIDPALVRFERAAPKRNYRRQLFYFVRGHVYRGFLGGSHWQEDEFMYVHFSRRNMSHINLTDPERYAVAPGGFYDLPKETLMIMELAEQLNAAKFTLHEASHRIRSHLRAFRRRFGIGPTDPVLR